MQDIGVIKILTIRHEFFYINIFVLDHNIDDGDKEQLQRKTLQNVCPERLPIQWMYDFENQFHG